MIAVESESCSLLITLLETWLVLSKDMSKRSAMISIIAGANRWVISVG